jgi:hypothetical protein
MCAPVRPNVLRGSTLNASLAETLSVALLAASLVWAVLRPQGRPEALVAVPAAAVVLAAGAISPPHALAEAERLGPVSWCSPTSAPSTGSSRRAGRGWPGGRRGAPGGC